MIKLNVYNIRILREREILVEFLISWMNEQVNIEKYKKIRRKYNK